MERAPWIKATVKYGAQVKPHWEQKSNPSLTDEEVMRSRTEPVGKLESAKPLNGSSEGRAPVHGDTAQA